MISAIACEYVNFSRHRTDLYIARRQVYYTIYYSLNLRLFTWRPSEFRALNVTLAVDSIRSGRPIRDRIADATSRLVTSVRPDSRSPPCVIFIDPMPSCVIKYV